MKILYNDKSITVAVKPCGVVSESSSGDSMISLLNDAFPHDTFYPVHRLDRETAGIMVYAKTKEAAAKLSASFASRDTKKIYLAVTDTPVLPTEGEMHDLLFHDVKRNRSYTVKRMRHGVKDASLVYRTLEEKDGHSLVAVRLCTGRTHQIRVQFASRHFPLSGDRRYGGSAGNTLALFAALLSFPHPKSGEVLTFSESPLEKQLAFCDFTECNLSTDFEL